MAPNFLFVLFFISPASGAESSLDGLETDRLANCGWDRSFRLGIQSLPGELANLRLVRENNRSREGRRGARPISWQAVRIPDFSRNLPPEGGTTKLPAMTQHQVC